MPVGEPSGTGNITIRARVRDAVRILGTQKVSSETGATLAHEACYDDSVQIMRVTARHAAFIGGACLLAAWLATAGSVRHAAEFNDAGLQPVAPTGSIAPIDPIVLEVRAQSERLTERLRAAPAPLEPGRNPFMFAAARAKPTPLDAGLRDLGATESSPSPPAGSALDLIGIAEHEQPDGVIRTAILTAPEGLLVVHEGEVVAGAFRVDQIDAAAVFLTHVETGGALKLGLK